MPISFGNEKPAEETFIKIAVSHYQHPPNTPKTSCYHHLASVLGLPDVELTDNIVLLGRIGTGDAIGHCILERDGEVIFDTNDPNGTLKGLVYSYSSTAGANNLEFEVKKTMSVEDFKDKYAPNFDRSLTPRSPS